MIELFLTFFKIGMFTLGGGYVMIPLVKDNCIEKKKWITEKEFIDILAIAECTPGPIAINMATYVGYKKKGIIGSIFATLGVIMPSLIVIYIVSLFFTDIMKIKIIDNAFKGIRICVSFVIIEVAYGMIKKEVENSDKKNIVIAIFILISLLILTTSFIGKEISTILIIITSIILAIIVSFVREYDL